jgi:prenylcysteine oxidase/farnesylcysteine lyase
MVKVVADVITDVRGASTAGGVVIVAAVVLVTVWIWWICWSALRWVLAPKKDPSEIAVLSPQRQIVCNDPGSGSGTAGSAKMRVAIIGAGASGSVAAYWLRKMGGDNVEIHIYDKNECAGGRVAKTEFNGRTYETGATIFHNANEYITGFCRLFNLTKIPVKKTGSKSAIYDGKNFVFRSSGWSIVDDVSMLAQYGLWPLLRLSRSVGEMLDKFASIYGLQASGRSFTCPQDLVLAFAGLEGLKALQTDGQSHLISSFDLPKSYFAQCRKLVRSLVSAGTRCNYGQTCDGLNGVCAQVSCAGTQSKELYYIKGGNYQLVRNLIDSSKASLHLSTAVTSIIETPGEGKFILKCEHKNIKSTSNLFDAVILACPIEGTECDIKYANGRDFERNIADAANASGHEMHRTVVTFVNGVLVPKFRGLCAVYTESVAADDNKLPWNSVGILYPVDAPMDECVRILKQVQAGQVASTFKVFSQRPLTDSELGEIFSKIETKQVVADWKAYPHYGFESRRTEGHEGNESSTAKPLRPADACYSFVVSPGIVSTCAIERVSSAVEMALIGGFNSALLVREHLIASRVAVPAY